MMSFRPLENQQTPSFKTYPTGLTSPEWNLIEPLLPAPRLATKSLKETF